MVNEGQCPGWAYRKDNKFLANACGWMERRSEQWTDAIIETKSVSLCTKGLKVQFDGFTKQELNTTYSEKAEEEVQGKVTYWDPSDSYFVYWQSSMDRWALCDRASLSQAKGGLAPGWAYRTDSAHFTRSRGWMEVYGRDWRAATITCLIHEGTVMDDHHAAVKAEMKDEEDRAPLVAVEQYHALITKVYEEKNQSKLADLPKLFQKYAGREHELYTNVCEKYEVDSDAFLAQGAALAAAVSQAGGKSRRSAPPAAARAKKENVENEEVPELSAKEYGTHVQNIYLQYNPKKIGDMGALLQKYRHKERELYHEVCNKYGVHPAKYHAENSDKVTEQLRVKAEQ